MSEIHFDMPSDQDIAAAMRRARAERAKTVLALFGTLFGRLRGERPSAAGLTGHTAAV